MRTYFRRSRDSMAKQPHCHRDGPRGEARETRGERRAYRGARPRVRAPRGAVAATLVVVVAAAVGATLAAGVTVSGISELLIQAGSGAQINGNPVEGSLRVCAGDQLTASSVEILLIAVAS